MMAFFNNRETAEMIDRVQVQIFDLGEQIAKLTAAVEQMQGKIDLRRRVPLTKPASEEKWVKWRGYDDCAISDHGRFMYKGEIIVPYEATDRKSMMFCVKSQKWTMASEVIRHFVPKYADYGKIFIKYHDGDFHNCALDNLEVGRK